MCQITSVETIDSNAHATWTMHNIQATACCKTDGFFVWEVKLAIEFLLNHPGGEAKAWKDSVGWMAEKFLHIKKLHLIDL